MAVSAAAQTPGDGSPEAKQGKSDVNASGLERSTTSPEQTTAAEGSPDHAVVKILSQEADGAFTVQDPYVPLPVDFDLEMAEDEENILRIRSIFVGAMLGGVVNAANLYLGGCLWSSTCPPCQVSEKMHC